MSKPIVDLSGNKYQWKQKGTDKPIYTVYAKTEKKAHKQFVGLLERLGILSKLEDMELLND